MAAGHAELLALAPKLAFCECWNEHLQTYMAFKLLPQRNDRSFLVITLLGVII